MRIFSISPTYASQFQGVGMPPATLYMNSKNVANLNIFNTSYSQFNYDRIDAPPQFNLIQATDTVETIEGLINDFDTGVNFTATIVTINNQTPAAGFTVANLKSQNILYMWAAPSSNSNVMYWDETLQLITQYVLSGTPSSLATAINAISNNQISPPLLVSIVETSATPGTVRTIVGSITMNATMSSGNIVGVRGEIDIPTSGNASGGYLYGIQGKLIGGTTSIINVGSGYACGVIGQIDISNTTCTSGHIAAVIANIQDSSNTSKTQVNCIYCETPLHGSGAVFNSVIQAIGSFNWGLDFAGAYCASGLFTAGSEILGTQITGTSVYIKVTIGGVAHTITAVHA